MSEPCSKNASTHDTCPKCFGQITVVTEGEVVIFREKCLNCKYVIGTQRPANILGTNVLLESCTSKEDAVCMASFKRNQAGEMTRRIGLLYEKREMLLEEACAYDDLAKEFDS